jgi:glycerophosphoryl diester phosphodiesterase
MKTIHRYFVIALLSLGTLTFFQCSTTRVQPSNLDTLDLQGHRGARGLKPENTWPAFRAAIDYRMTTLELDTVLTKDGAVIIHHDSDTNPIICQMPDGAPIQKRNIYDMTLSELKELDCGAKKNPNFPDQTPVPGTKLITIEEFFKLVAEAEKQRKGRGTPPLNFNIETKFPNDNNSSVSDERVQEHVTKLVKAVENAKVVNRTTIQSFYLPALGVVKLKNDKIKTSALYAPTYFQGFMMVIGMGSGYRKTILNSATELRADVISPYFLYVNENFMQEAKFRKISVIPWTVNEEKEMKRLISLGVDGIITDYPNKLRDVTTELKEKQSK